MKNGIKLAVVVALMLIGNYGTAQVFGVKGSVGLANISSPDEFYNSSFGRTLGLKIGGTIEFDITDEFYVGSGLSFAKKGASTFDEGNFNLLYLELPVSARYEITEVGDSGYFYAASGFTLGAMLSARVDGEKYTINASTGNFKPIELGFNIGVGILFDDRFDVGITFDFGLTDISTTNNSILRNAGLLAYFGYRFDM